jgi:hypothetical protein
MKRHMVLGAIILAFFLTFGGAITASTGYAANSNIDGEWQATYNTPIGAMNCHYTFKSAGNLLTGKVVAEMGGSESGSEISEGKIDGDKITFAWTYNNDVPMTTTGKITGDEIQLTRQAGSYGTESAVATRVQSGK